MQKNWQKIFLFLFSGIGAFSLLFITLAILFKHYLDFDCLGFFNSKFFQYYINDYYFEEFIEPIYGTKISTKILKIPPMLTLISLSIAWLLTTISIKNNKNNGLAFIIISSLAHIFINLLTLHEAIRHPEIFPIKTILKLTLIYISIHCVIFLLAFTQGVKQPLSSPKQAKLKTNKRSIIQYWSIFFIITTGAGLFFEIKNLIISTSFVPIGIVWKIIFLILAVILFASAITVFHLKNKSSIITFATIYFSNLILTLIVLNAYLKPTFTKAGGFEMTQEMHIKPTFMCLIVLTGVIHCFYLDNKLTKKKK